MLVVPTASLEHTSPPIRQLWALEQVLSLRTRVSLPPSRLATKVRKGVKKRVLELEPEVVRVKAMTCEVLLTPHTVSVRVRVEEPLLIASVTAQERVGGRGTNRKTLMSRRRGRKEGGPAGNKKGRERERERESVCVCV